jgi:hypothetical protein
MQIREKAIKRIFFAECCFNLEVPEKADSNSVPKNLP